MVFLLIFAATIGSFANAQRINEIDANGLETPHEPPKQETVTKVGVKCNSEDITITVTTIGDQFNGMIYPKGLSKKKKTAWKFRCQWAG
jgi:hypothetical protein